MDNAAQIDLHTASVVLIKQDHSISLFQYVSYIYHTTTVTCRRRKVAAADARIVQRDCGPTIMGPSLQWAEFTIYRFKVL